MLAKRSALLSWQRTLPCGAPRLLCVSREHYHHCHGFVCEPRAPDDESPPVAIRLLSGPPHHFTMHGLFWPRGLHLAQFRYKHRPPAKAVDYAEHL